MSLIMNISFTVVSVFFIPFESLDLFFLLTMLHAYFILTQSLTDRI